MAEEKKGKGSTESKAMVGKATPYLTNLPARGNFSSVVLPSNLGGARVYICEKDTQPPDGQVIKTNQTNILIRSLTIGKQKSDSISKDARSKSTAENAKGKRAAERPVDGRSTAKRANITLDSRSSRQDGSSSRTSEKDFQNLTVERLRAILKERGLSTKGRKDELIARLRGCKGE